MTKLRILLVSVFPYLMACGGGSDKAKTTSTELEPSPIVVEEPVQSTGFSDITVSDTFNWSMQSQANANLKLVSNFTDNQVAKRPISVDGQSILPQVDNMPVAGSYIVKVFGIDQDENIITSPVFTGLTDKYGELPINFNIPNDWLGILVDVTSDAISCSQRVESSEIQQIIPVGCDIATTSDL